MTENYNANVNVRDLPRMINHILSMLALARGVPKWVIVREALIEYAESHKREIVVPSEAHIETR